LIDKLLSRDYVLKQFITSLDGLIVIGMEFYEVVKTRR